MGLSSEQYFHLWRQGIEDSKLSIQLKSDVLSNIRYIPYFDLGLVVIDIPPQKEVSHVGNMVYVRRADQTTSARELDEVNSVYGRFLK